MGAFAQDVRNFVDKAKRRRTLFTQKIAVEILSRLVQRSPVGNPELWAANAEQLTKREQHNFRATVAGDFGGKKQRPLSARTLKKRYPVLAGQGYVGGRFRGNWLVTIGGPSQGTISRVDPSGSETIDDGTATIRTLESGETIYIMNNLPYAQRLEYGWSKQAPAGMVRLTVAEFQAIVADAARAVSSAP